MDISLLLMGATVEQSMNLEVALFRNQIYQSLAWS